MHTQVHTMADMKDEKLTLELCQQKCTLVFINIARNPPKLYQYFISTFLYLSTLIYLHLTENKQVNIIPKTHPQGPQ